MKKTIIIWILAVLITIASAVWQRMSGPTYPVRTKAEVGEQEVSLRLPRSNNGIQEFFVEVPDETGKLDGMLYHRHYPQTSDEDKKYTPVKPKREDGTLKFLLPDQMAAGKLEYYLTITDGQSNTDVRKDDPVVIRFTDPVSDFILIPHILMMFLGMLFTNVAALMAIMNVRKYRFYLLIALILLVVGGLILGPLVQWQAFGDLWTGWPFGQDLTDNKLAVAVLAMAIAYFGNLKKDRRFLVVIAAIVVLVIFSIPHSMMGSELNRESMEITTG